MHPYELHSSVIEIGGEQIGFLIRKLIFVKIKTR